MFLVWCSVLNDGGLGVFLDIKYFDWLCDVR